MFQKRLFLVTQNGGQSPPSPPIATAMNMQSEKKFFFRNKGLYLLFYPRLNLILLFFLR